MKTLFKKIFGGSKETIIVVSGLPRSGTSMMMRVLEAGGLPPLTDGLRAADSDNPRGYFEFERVKQLKVGDTEWLPEAKGKAVKIISSLLPYLPDRYDYKVIFMRRVIKEILASQRTMIHHRKEDAASMDDEKLERLYNEHLKQIESWLKSTSYVQHMDIEYNGMLTRPAPYVEKINKFLGGGLNADRMAEAVDAKLYRQRF